MEKQIFVLKRQVPSPKEASETSKTMKNALPNLEDATITPDKLTEQSLNPEHPVGGNKVKVFESTQAVINQTQMVY